MPQDASQPNANDRRLLRPDTEGVHPIANTDRLDRVADIVFVHGLGGGSNPAESFPP